MIIVLVTSILLAAILHWGVEKPCITLSKKLTEYKSQRSKGEMNMSKIIERALTHKAVLIAEIGVNYYDIARK